MVHKYFLQAVASKDTLDEIAGVGEDNRKLSLNFKILFPDEAAFSPATSSWLDAIASDSYFGSLQGEDGNVAEVNAQCA